MLGVDCLTGRPFLGLQAGVARFIEVTFSILSLSGVVVCEVVSVIRYIPIAFGKSFGRSSCAICLAAMFSVGGRLTYT